MSLDVYLRIDETKEIDNVVFWTEDGEEQMFEMDELLNMCPEFPLKHLVFEKTVFTAEITGNLGDMAKEADIEKALWRPHEIGVSKATQLIPLLTEGLTLLRSNPKRFKIFNPKNGCGDYEELCRFVDSYISACIAFPDARVRAW